MTAADTVKDLPRQVKRCPECGTGFGVDAAFCPFDGIALKTGTWDPSRDPLTDTVIDNRYEVVAPLGEGGMGTVYKVRHMTLDRMFAMKVLRRDLAKDTDLAERFLREARATAAIRHPSVVAINDFGSLDDGTPYFVMDLLMGQTLATRMGGRGPLPPSEASSIARKLADALSAAHAANVVHRDLKPENVFLVGSMTGKAPADDVRIVDFGAAKIVGGSKLTRPGVVFGTPYYMSPEQASGQPVDARADIYSLGVLLYEMITGSVPFEADTYMGVLTKHMFATPTNVSERVPAGVELGDLETVINRALEKEPSERYASMKDLAHALELASVARSPSSPRKTRSGRPVAFNAMSTADRIQRSVTRHVDEEDRRRRRNIAVAIVGAAATLALGALIVTILETKDKPRSTTTTALSAPVASVTSVPAGPAAYADLATSSSVPPPPASASASPSATASPGSVAAAAGGTPTVPVARPASPAPVLPRGKGTATPTTSAAAAPNPAPSPRPSTPKPSDDFADPWRTGK